jgi:hypothetical protein
MEEAAITLVNIQLVGRWATKKRFRSPHNAKYPDQGYQLLYVADVKELNEFTPRLEIAGRIVVPISEVVYTADQFLAGSVIPCVLKERIDPGLAD